MQDVLHNKKSKIIIAFDYMQNISSRSDYLEKNFTININNFNSLAPMPPC